MPKATFLNLTVDKQEKIEMILLATFYNRHISQVKVSEIVEKMGMSRGAFYKYFNDLEDAHQYVVQKASVAVHREILTFVYTMSDDLFAGIKTYLKKIAGVDKTAKEWQQIQLLTANPTIFAKRNSHNNGQNAMVLQWQELLIKNDISLDTLAESQELLFLIMDLVMEVLTAFIVNDWGEKELVDVYQLRIKWLKQGIQQK
ncbi:MULTISPECIES: TetR family transcriptional regulator [Enterococcus]|uniref:TetR family transcriptional regulator n=1 Tax=Enterococcus TaxID=1350 RepID=UPI001E567C33|nr:MULTISPECIES: TetR family transcriptional regulator [Enterococcus]MCD1024837.1 TetR family transcriptional regulator [Enterococcus sp. SMC-9]MDT2740147.1 TetR family transcriptional regulator [Enterococcus canintestini]WHA08952.1 TetR family transcriptional regulator [Enterococcus montenegrensis]